MNPKIINEILQILQDTLKSGVDVVQSQFPILCEQILRYSLLSNSVGMAISVFITICSVTSIIIGISKHESGDYMDESSIIFIIIGSVTGVVALCAAVAFSMDVIKVITAPNLVLLEAIRGMAK